MLKRKIMTAVKQFTCKHLWIERFGIGKYEIKRNKPPEYMPVLKRTCMKCGKKQYKYVDLSTKKGESWKKAVGLVGKSGGF